ncbi:heat-inducible transcriptional repressor HrcA [Dehalobacter sp. DCM]|uniref:heat-inducible transcriptional repressor HrcA n=1 Tax=Dehalobacter sp. DCM TaxID=2907827 RepID=UPI0030816E8D|nr:heat-inducible transcriptional repressor HrcA [Dehalobacter sp. DCM]
MEMDERKHKILKAIVQDYIATAEPVGSRTISKKFELGVSPATIRNEMADLEEMGLIEQPHTSAGRVPSDSGYRYYVDYLMDPLILNKEEQKSINQEMTSRLSEVQEVITYTGKLISQITNLTSIVLGPKSRSSVLKNMYFLPYEQGKAIMVTVKENGTVENNIVDIGTDTTPEELQLLANIFNQKMSGTRVQDMKKGLIEEIYGELSRKRRIIDGMMGILERMFDDNEGAGEERIYLGGTLNMLDQPEFRDIDKVRNLFAVFNENNKLKELIKPDHQGVNVMIGAENADQVFKNCSVISATYQINGKQIGSVGVLGPTRMDYGKAITIVDYMTKSLTELLTERHRKPRR